MTVVSVSLGAGRGGGGDLCRERASLWTGHRRVFSRLEPLLRLFSSLLPDFCDTSPSPHLPLPGSLQSGFYYYHSPKASFAKVISYLQAADLKDLAPPYLLSVDQLLLASSQTPPTSVTPPSLGFPLASLATPAPSSFFIFLFFFSGRTTGHVGS